MLSVQVLLYNISLIDSPLNRKNKVILNPNRNELTNTNNSTLQHTPTIQKIYSRNIHAQWNPQSGSAHLKHTTFDHNRLPYFNTQQAYVWWSRVWCRVENICDADLPFTPYFWAFHKHQWQSLRDAMQRFSSQYKGRCLFLLLLMEWSEGEKWSEKKGETYDDQVFFPSFRECFTL